MGYSSQEKVQKGSEGLSSHIIPGTDVLRILSMRERERNLNFRKTILALIQKKQTGLKVGRRVTTETFK